MALVQYLLQPHPEKIITTTAFLLLWLHYNSPEIRGKNLDSGKFRAF
jgi:hypothetical protein